MNYFIYDALTRLVKNEGEDRAADIAFNILERTEKEDNYSEKYRLWNYLLPAKSKLTKWSKVKEILYDEPTSSFDLMKFFAGDKLDFSYEMLFSAMQNTENQAKKTLTKVFDNREASENQFGWKVVQFTEEVRVEYDYCDVEVSIALTPKGIYFMNYDELMPFSEVIEKYISYAIVNRNTNKSFSEWIDEELICY